MRATGRHRTIRGWRCGKAAMSPRRGPNGLSRGFSNDDHWARSVVDDLLADRAQLKARKASATTVADNEEVRVSRLLQQDVRGLPFDRNALTLQGRLQASYNRNRLTHDVLCTVAKHLDYRRVHTWREPAGICSRGTCHAQTIRRVAPCAAASAVANSRAARPESDPSTPTTIVSIDDHHLSSLAVARRPECLGRGQRPRPARAAG